MKDQDHELLSQYLDGELGAPQVLHLERRLAAEPQLQAHLERLQDVDAAVKSAFNMPGADAVPPRISQMLQKPASNVVAFPPRRRAGWGFAIAVSVLAASGLLFLDESRQSPDGTLGDDALLAQELEYSPSRADGWDQLDDGRRVRLVLSFHSRNNGWCREYMLAEDGQYWRGVACRGEGRWINEVISPAGSNFSGSTADYRPAGANDSDQIQRFVDSQANDIALSAQAEAELLSIGWQ
ncbi:MAG: hypothetical protein P8L39_16430 [Halioglobus sp.]|nr:hypothetical protein [Halioglobus sp.]